MHGSLRLTAIILALAMAPPSWGCLAPSRPGDDADYKTIILAEVVGVHLTEYAQFRVQEVYDGNSWATDGSLAYEVDLITFETFKGSAGRTLSLRVPSGCAIPTAELNQFAIFYVRESGDALIIPQNYHDYRERLKKFGSRYTSTCNTSKQRFTPHPCWKPEMARLECVLAVHRITQMMGPSCPAGPQAVYEQLSGETLAPYDWKPPLYPQEK